MDINATATDQGAELILNHMEDSITHYVLLGSKEYENAELGGLVADPNATYDTINSYIIYTDSATAAYYDVNGILTFDLPLEYEPDLGCWIYGLALIAEHNGEEIVVSISETPKIMKTKGIGGSFIYKLDVSGEPGTIIFSNNTEIASDEEALALIRGKAVEPYHVKLMMEQFGLYGNPLEYNDSNSDLLKDLTFNSIAHYWRPDTRDLEKDPLPWADNAFFVLTMANTGGWRAKQIAYRRNTQGMRERNLLEGIWSDWIDMIPRALNNEANAGSGEGLISAAQLKQSLDQFGSFGNSAIVPDNMSIDTISETGNYFVSANNTSPSHPFPYAGIILEVYDVGNRWLAIQIATELFGGQYGRKIRQVGNGVQGGVTEWEVLRPSNGFQNATPYGAGFMSTADKTKLDTLSKNIDASQVISGAFHVDRIPNLAAGKITSGAFTTDRIPVLDAAKITSGTISAARLPIATDSTNGIITAAERKKLNGLGVNSSYTSYSYGINITAPYDGYVFVSAMTSTNEWLYYNLIINSVYAAHAVSTMLYQTCTIPLTFVQKGQVFNVNKHGLSMDDTGVRFHRIMGA